MLQWNSKPTAQPLLMWHSCSRAHTMKRLQWMLLQPIFSVLLVTGRMATCCNRISLSLPCFVCA